MTEVNTEAGRVAGVRDGRVWCWRGVPYGAPPTGARRFRPPAPAEPWAGVRDGSCFGPAAAQRVAWLGGGHTRLGPSLSEDCLYLNVWSPAVDGRARSVLVWLHGGAFVSGSGALYRGEPLAAGGDIVVVTLNYRLGVFGFADLGPAMGDAAVGCNLGLQDCIAALGWVRRNIAAFGGDPGRVTLAGESAGSILVSLLMLSDAATLFDQAILQSGAFNLVHTAETGRTIANAYLDHLRPRPRSLAELQRLPTDALLDAEAAVARAIKGASPAAPVFDGALLPGTLAEALARPTRPMPLLAGANRDEIALFRVLPGPKILRMNRPELLDLVRRDLPPPAATAVEHAYPDTAAGERALGSDANFVMPTLHVAERHAARGAPTWVYRFDYAHPWLRAYHALDLLFLWPFPGLLAAVLRGGFLTGLRSGLSERMRAAWTSFVRTGSPGEDWPAYRAPERSTRLFALQDRVVADPMRARREAWCGRDIEGGR